MKKTRSKIIIKTRAGGYTKIWKKGNYDTCVHPNDKDACKKCMLDWLQSEAE